MERADWSAAAFARLKSVTVTGMKNQVRFNRYGIEVAVPSSEASACPSFGCDSGYQQTAGWYQPAPARAPCPPSRPRFRRHARGHQRVPAPGTISPLPDLSDHLAPPVRRDYDHFVQATPHQ